MKRHSKKCPSCDTVPLKCQAVKHLSSNILFEKTVSVLSDEEFLSPTLEGGRKRERFCLKLTKYSRETNAEM
jgi:hypothetical protein